MCVLCSTASSQPESLKSNSLWQNINKFASMGGYRFSSLFLFFFVCVVFTLYDVCKNLFHDRWVVAQSFEH